MPFSTQLPQSSLELHIAQNFSLFLINDPQLLHLRVSIPLFFESSLISTLQHEPICCCYNSETVFLSRLKDELLNTHFLRSEAEPYEKLADYIDFYNSERIQKSLDSLSPDEFE